MLHYKLHGGNWFPVLVTDCCKQVIDDLSGVNAVWTDKGEVLLVCRNKACGQRFRRSHPCWEPAEIFLRNLTRNAGLSKLPSQTAVAYAEMFGVSTARKTMEQ